MQPLTLHFRIGNVKPDRKIGIACRAALAAAHDRGELPYYYGPGVMFMYGKDEVYIHGVRVPADPTSAADLTRAEMQGRADAHAMFPRLEAPTCRHSPIRISSRRTPGSACASRGGSWANMCSARTT